MRNSRRAARLERGKTCMYAREKERLEEKKKHLFLIVCEKGVLVFKQCTI